jgi:hypothetical protein
VGIMNRLARLLAVFGAVGCAAWATYAVAFDINSDNSTGSANTAAFADPDDQPLPGMLGRA